MKAEELRIGNWVLCNGLRTIVIISLLKYISDKNIQFTVDPLRLTEEWLLKFGFKYISEVAGYADSKHLVVYTEDGFIFHPFCTNDTDCHIIVKYVHQLQNLYFALAGEELIIKDGI